MRSVLGCASAFQSVALNLSTTLTYSLSRLCLLRGRLDRRRRLATLLDRLALPLRRFRPLRILPRPRIAQLTPTLTIARPAKQFREILLGYLREQLRLISAAENMNFRNGDRIQPPLDDGKNAAEAPGGVDQIEFPETLGVVVLADGGGLLDVAVDGGDFGDADAFEVHDCAAGFEEFAGFAGAGGEAGVGELFVLVYEVLEHAFRGGDFVHGVEVDAAQLLDIDGSTVLEV